MRRRLVSLASVLLLMLCAASAMFCVRSYFGTDHFLARWHNAGGCDVMVESVAGRVEISVGDQSEVQGPAPLEWKVRHFDVRTSSAPQSIPGSIHMFGMLVGYDGDGYPRHFTWIIVPYWMPFAASLALAVSVCHARRGHASKEKPSCCQCGYNLNGNVSGVCPECGTAVSGKPGA